MLLVQVSMMRPLLLVLLSTYATVLAATPPIQFEQNRGQTDGRVRYLARYPQGTVFFTDREIVFSRGETKPVRFELLDSNREANWELSEPTGEQTFYMVGRDRSRWADDVRHYARLGRRSVYPGIDETWYGKEQRIEYDFLIAPGSDPRRIRIRIKGARRVSINHEGELVVASDSGEIRQHKPNIYQTAGNGSRSQVSGGFQLLGPNEAGFTVDVYDHSQPLIIDPVIDFASYVGGEGDDQVIYSSGGITAGNTTSIDFPGASPSRKKGSDVFFKNGSFTYVFGGSGEDRLTGLVTSFISGPILFGYTNSTDLPTAALFGSSVIQANYAGGASDGFIVYPAVDPAFRTSRLAISYYGTSGEDRITGAVSSPCALTGWTTGRGLPLGGSFLIPAPPLVQDGPGGAADGFLAACSTSGNLSSPTFTITGVKYFGGSGDDRPTAISYYLGYLVAGETSSSDFPNLTDVSTPRGGDSDAFVIRYLTLASTPSSVLFGGSGPDAANAITILPAQQTVAIAGTTGSPDLTLANPTQSAYGGGSSDAFVVTYTPQLSQIVYSTYFGGSASEQVTSASSDGANGMFIGGWTASPDFPVINAVQPVYGGGPVDGFLLHYDATGNIHQSTFYGGSGSDRILGVTTTSPFQASIAGQTDSPDLPVRNTQQEGLRGPSDGFAALISTKLIGASNVAGSKGLRAATFFTIPNMTTAVTFTLTSSNPGLVLLADSRDGPPASSITITSTTSTDYFVDCRADAGTAEIRFDAPGYPSARARATCVWPTLAPSVSSVTSLGPGVYRLSAWSEPVRIFLSMYAVNPNNRNELNILFAKSDQERIPVQVQSSNPSVVDVSVSSTLVGGSTDSVPVVTAASIGAADVTFSSSDFLEPVVLRFTVVSPITVTSPAPIPVGFQASYFVGLAGRVPPDRSITFRSGDPSRLLITTDPAMVGTEVVTVPLGVVSPRPYLQALTSGGEVPLTVSVTGFDSVTVPVRFKQPALTASSSLLSSPVLTPGQTTNLFGSFESYIPNPANRGIRLTLESSDASVVKVTPAFVDFSPTVWNANFQVQGVTAGTAALTLRSSNGVAASPEVNPLRITVANRPMQLNDIELGNNLSAQMVLSLPTGIPSNSTINISSSNPGNVLLASTSTGAGQPQISVRATGSTLGFYVHGLGESSESKITAEVAGFGSITATVTLVPSGFGWVTDYLSSDLYSILTQPFVSAYALDPATLVPIAAQSLRPGITATIQVQSDRPDIALPVNGSVVLPASSVATMRNIATGDAVLTLLQPPGFSLPVSRQRLLWHVAPTLLRLNVNSTLGINTQRQVTYFELPAAARTKIATITTSDPRKLVVSADPAVLGLGTLALTAGTPFYLQALDSRGTVSITVSVDGFADTTQMVPLRGTGIMLAAQSESSWGIGSIFEKMVRTRHCCRGRRESDSLSRSSIRIPA